MQAFHTVTRTWFEECFDAPTSAQAEAWKPITSGASTLLMAPTGSGKTLAAFLFALDQLMFGSKTLGTGCRILYISPIKALGVDVERNLRSPLTGLATVAKRGDVPFQQASVAIRSGDTSANERARMVRSPPDILITTPESLFLMLTSKAREILKTIDVVIVDEIHALVPSKRGTHLFLSLERLEALREGEEPLQRIGLSATQRPLEEVSRLLAGSRVKNEQIEPRPVQIVDVGEKKELKLKVEVPTADMVNFSDLDPLTSDGQIAIEGTGSDGRVRSIWPTVYPRLLEHIRSHRSTLVFVNSRRTAERLANALNELAEEEIARAHHGSLAPAVRAEIEDLLKRGKLPAIVATASLELGIDMGAIDLVVQVEAPPSIAAGLQRVGRAMHHVGGVPEGVTFPKFRGDLVTCAAAGRAMLDGLIESTKYPRNPLDVLAQQLVAIVSMDDQTRDGLFDLVRQAAPFRDLTPNLFDSVLDMLSGRYPSDDFQELRPRITWDRLTGILSPRKGAKRLAVINAGTIPERGLYGVFLAGEEQGRSRRVGELDEEMVFECRVGEVILLGASSWRVEEITHDRVLVTPAPGEMGKMPFWRGDRPGRPLEFGQVVGEFLRTVSKMEREEAQAYLVEHYTLDQNGAVNLVNYIEEQTEAGSVPTDQCIVLERFLDEIGDWRICLLSPFGAAVHAPWAMAVRARLLEEYALELDVIWSDDGIVFRMPEGDQPPDEQFFFPEPAEVEERIIARLADTSLFASRFRENAGRSLLLPKKRPGGRSPLWALRRRAASLLSVASRFRDFPIILETYRECLQDQFDVPGLRSVLEGVQQRRIQVRVQETDAPSPFAAALMFQYVANFMYEGDAPLAERRAQALTIDHVRLRELLGDAALRELIDPNAIETIERQLQREDQKLDSLDDIHDLLLSFGPMDDFVLTSRAEDGFDVAGAVDKLIQTRRIVKIRMANRPCYAAAEDSGRLRDALGVVVPPGLPEAFLEPVEDAIGDLILRYARTRGPFLATELAAHYGLGRSVVLEVLKRLEKMDKVVSGEFLPHGTTQEWCSSDVLRRIKKASLSRLRAEVESVSHESFARFSLQWHGITETPSHQDGLIDIIERLQGTPIPATVLETDVLPARVTDYQTTDLDALLAAGEVVWIGLRPTGSKDGRIALYTHSHLDLLASQVEPLEGEVYESIRTALRGSGATFFNHLHGQVGGLPTELLTRLWDLVWHGEVSNDSLVPLRNLMRGGKRKGTPQRRRPRFRSSRQTGLPGSEGRWWLVSERRSRIVMPTTDRRMALTHQLLERHGVFTREAISMEELLGGFSSVYPILKALEESGQVRRGYFVEGLGATQFAVPGAEDMLRAQREDNAELTGICIAATDPANPYGAAIPWPAELSGRPERSPGARVVLANGKLIAFISRSGKSLTTNLSDDEVARRRELDALATALKGILEKSGQRTVFFESVNGEPPEKWREVGRMLEHGFRNSSSGLLLTQKARLENLNARR